MANVIKHKRGSGSDPVASDLVVGEVAIRTDVGKLFTKMDNGSVAEIAGGGSDIAINTLSSSSATGGGSATFNGSAYRFTLSAPPSVSAQQLLVSINGVIQKPVAGTGQPSEGFSVDGTDIILGDAPATGSDFFILTFKSLGVSEPADNSVTSAKIVDGAIVNADINASAAIASSKLAKPIDFADNEKARFGTGNDLEIYHTGTSSNIVNSTGLLKISAGSSANYIQSDSNVWITKNNATETMAKFSADGAVELYHDNSKKFETISSGVSTDGLMNFNGTGDKILIGDNGKAVFGGGLDLQIYHDGSNSYLKENGTGGLYQQTNGNGIFLQKTDGENMANFVTDGAVELYHNGTKKAETASGGFTVTGTCTATSFAGDGSNLTGITAGAQGGGGESIFFESENEMNNNYTISTNHNALIAGPLTIASGATLTINSPSVVTIP